MWYIMASAQEAYNLSDRLMRAISHMSLPGHDEGVEELLEQGADLNRLHGTLLPLHCACMVKDDDCVQLLIDRGAKVNAIDGYGRAAIHYAAERSAECLEKLIAHGADVNMRDASDATPLHWASFKNLSMCVRLLLENGADVNAVELNNDSAISWAAHKNNLESIRILLEYNASVDIVNYNGVIPLRRALQIHEVGLNSDNDNACLDLLIRASGQIDLRDKEGEWPVRIKGDNRLMEMFQPLSENVQSLLSLSRYSIRRHIGSCYLPNIVYKLPIPTGLQHYILLHC